MTRAGESPNLSEELGTIDSLAKRDGQTATGVYLLTGHSEHMGQSGQARLQLTLEDATGRATAFVWPEARDAVAITDAPTPVLVIATAQLFDGKAQLKVHGLEAANLECVMSATDLLPRRRCPDTALAALSRLTRLERELPAPLDSFLRRVLLDSRISLAFLRCRASVSHHHSLVGGLLTHSTEMLDLAGEITQQTIPSDAWSPYLAQLAYLLHDLGKLKSVGELRRPEHALIVGHEFLTIEMLAPHLRWLEEQDARLAVALRHVFAYLATPFRGRTTPQHIIAEVVETLDQWSAAKHNGRTLDHLLNRPASSRGRFVPTPRNKTPFGCEQRPIGRFPGEHLGCRRTLANL